MIQAFQQGLDLHTVTAMQIYGVQEYEVKKDMLDTIRKAYTVIHAWDDNPSIIKLWTEEGIPTTTVPGWEDR
jgi:hypothetical protein